MMWLPDQHQEQQQIQLQLQQHRHQQQQRQQQQQPQQLQQQQQQQQHLIQQQRLQLQQQQLLLQQQQNKGSTNKNANIENNMDQSWERVFQQQQQLLMPLQAKFKARNHNKFQQEQNGEVQCIRKGSRNKIKSRKALAKKDGKTSKNEEPKGSNNNAKKNDKKGNDTKNSNNLQQKKRIRWTISENVTFVKEMEKFPSGAPFSEGYGKVKQAWETLAMRLKTQSRFVKYQRLDAKKCQEHFKRLYDEFLRCSNKVKDTFSGDGIKVQRKYSKYPPEFTISMERLHSVKQRSPASTNTKPVKAIVSAPGPTMPLSYGLNAPGPFDSQSLYQNLENIGIKRPRDILCDVLGSKRQMLTNSPTNKNQQLAQLHDLLLTQNAANEKRFQELTALISSQRKVIAMLISKQ